MKIVSRDRWNELLLSIYDCALHPDKWADVLLEIGAPINSHAGQLVTFSVRTGKTVDDRVVGLDTERAVREFEELLIRGENIRANWSNSQPDRSQLYDYQHISEKEMSSSLYYQEHAIPLDVAYYSAGILRPNGKETTAIAHFRTKRFGHFSVEELKYLKELLPHVEKSLLLTAQLPREGAADGAELICHGLNCAALLQGEDGRVIFSNEKASTLLKTEDGICIRRDRQLNFADDHAMKALANQSRDALGATNTGQTTRFFVRRPSGKTPFQVSVIPFFTGSLGSNGHLLLVLILDPDEDIDISSQELQETYGLTPAEAGVAVYLALGVSINEIARKRGRKVSTVQSQVKKILSKTGCRRQAELVGKIVQLSRL